MKSQVAAALGAALAVSTPALAQSAGSDARVSELVVVGHSLEDTLPEELSKVGVRVEQVTDAEIRNGSYLDVATSLQALAPGLYVQPKNGPFDYVDISFQGSRTTDVLWLVDGVRINNRLYAGTTPLDSIPSSIVDHIEVVEGGQALFYGTQAIAGAVNIVTRPFTATRSGGLTVGGDTNYGWHLDTTYANGFGKSQVVLYGTADQSKGYKAFRDQDYQPSSTDRRRSYGVYTLGGKLGLDVTDALRLSGSYQHTWANVDFAQPYRVASNENRRKEDLAWVKADFDASDKLSFYLKGYWHNWDTHYDTVYNDLQAPGAQIQVYDNAFWGFWDYGANALGKWTVSKGVEAYFGYDLQRYGGRDEVLVIEQNDETTHALFGQLRLTPELVPHLSLAAGVRYNHPSVGQSSTIWTVSGRYDVSDQLFLRGVVGTNFRLPTAEELFANDPSDERGNPDLKPERAKSLNISVGGRFDVGPARAHWELIGFFRDIEDLIDFTDFDDNTNQDVFGNAPGVVRVRGFEGVLGADFGEAVSGEVSYSYNSSKQDDGDQLRRIPKTLFKGSLDYHPADNRYGATVNLTYTGDVDEVIRGVRAPYGDYVVVDLSGRYYLDDAHRHQFTLSLQNLFDEAYGRPSRGCLDTPDDGPFACSQPYIYVNRGLPRTLRASYAYKF